MDVETAARFISTLTKSLQTVLHGCLDFENDIELGGYIYLRIDSSDKMDYVLSEKMQKNDVNSLTFLSNSFHAIPQGSADPDKSKKENCDTNTKVRTGQNTISRTERLADESRLSNHQTERFAPSHSRLEQPKFISDSNSASQRRHSDTEFAAEITRLQQSGQQLEHAVSVATGPGQTSSSDQSTCNTSYQAVPGSSADGKQSLTDFQTAFHSSRASVPVSSHMQQPSTQSFPFTQVTASQQQQQKGKGTILPDPGDMEVVYIKTEEEDEDVFSIPLNPTSGSATDDLTMRRKPPWLSMSNLYFPYPRLARSQSWDRRFAQATSSSKYPNHTDDSSVNAESYSCKVCGKCYRSRQGLIFHERVKHQNIFNVYCPVCGKGFQQASHMYGHMATHTNVKNFQCPVCGAKYAHKTSLQQHLRSGSCRATPISQGEAQYSKSLTMSTSRDLTTSITTVDLDNTNQGQTVNQNVGKRKESMQEEPSCVISSQERREYKGQPAESSSGENEAADFSVRGEDHRLSLAGDASITRL